MFSSLVSIKRVGIEQQIPAHWWSSQIFMCMSLLTLIRVQHLLVSHWVYLHHGGSAITTQITHLLSLFDYIWKFIFKTLTIWKLLFVLWQNFIKPGNRIESSSWEKLRRITYSCSPILTLLLLHVLAALNFCSYRFSDSKQSFSSVSLFLMCGAHEFICEVLFGLLPLSATPSFSYKQWT